MASYSSKLKTWGSVGSEYPDSYNYSEGEQPVDAWDNYLTYNLIEDVSHLVELTNKRIESSSGASHPSSPEPGELSHRTDSPDGTSKEELYQYDGTNETWERVLKASGDTMTGVLDMGGYQITDNTGPVTLDGIRGPGGDLDVADRMHVGSDATVNGNSVYHEGNTTIKPIHKEETRTLAAGNRESVTYSDFTDFVPTKIRLEASEADAYARARVYYTDGNHFEWKHTNSGTWEIDEFDGPAGYRLVGIELIWDNQTGVDATMTVAIGGMALW